MLKKALIFGISGQDGSYLAKYLIKKKYKVYGTTRIIKKKDNLEKLNIQTSVKIYKVDPKSFKSVHYLISKLKPNEIYYLAGISSISEANKSPIKTYDSIVKSTLNVLESVRQIKDFSARLFFAGSTECFGNLLNKNKPFNEKTIFNGKNIYSLSKSSSFKIVKYYRQNYNLWCCTGILSNHESSLRSNKYISKKIINGAKNIYLNNQKYIQLGNINISRDWGWAPEYVKGFHKMLNYKKPTDFIIATGKTNSLEVFISLVFEHYKMDWKNYIIFSKKLIRNSDIKYTKFDINSIRKKLGWAPKITLKEIVEKMIKNEI